jgi:hypothetical protein
LPIRSALVRAGAVVSGGAIVLLSAAPASALDLGAVPVPVLAPAVGSPPAPVDLPAVASVTVSVAVPPVVRVEPIGVNAGEVASGLDAAVSVSSAPGVGVDVTLPTSPGPVALAAGTPTSIQASVGPDGTNVALPTGGVTLPGGPTVVGAPTVPPLPGEPTVVGASPVPPVPGTPQIGPADATTGLSGSSASGSSAAGVTPDGKSSPTVRSSRPASTDAPGAAHVSISGASPARPAPGGPLGSVDAALRHPAPEQSSSLWRAIDAVTTRQGLLIALLVLVMVARCAAGGLLRDALRRTRSTASP